MIILGSLDIIPLVSAMGAAAILLILFGSISGSRAVTMVDWRVLLVIASSFGIAVAMEKSGVGSFFAHEFIQLFHPLGIYGIIAALYCITALYTNFITNNTAAVLLFPIALNIAGELDTNILPFIVAIAIGASSSFATPISYQTNLMVYGPGSYKFTDFLRVGIPLQIIIAIVTILLIGYFYF
jgi:di/tricarboxylate transporter